MAPPRTTRLAAAGAAVVVLLVGVLLGVLVAGRGGTSPGSSAQRTSSSTASLSAGATGSPSTGSSAAASSDASGGSGATVGSRVSVSALDGATVPSPLTVTAPDDAKQVRWVVDGAFVAKDVAPPFSVTLQLAPGKHKLVARMDTTGSGRQDIRASFTVAAATPVGGGGTAGSPPTNAPDPTKALPPLPQPRRVVPVTTTAELQAALAGARPGDEIRLADGTYDSAFVASASGTASAPIVLRGSRGAVVTTGDTRGGGYAMHVTGSFWRLVGFTVRQAKKGVVLDGSVGTILQGLDIGSIGQEAVHFRSSSSRGAVVDCDIHNTGEASPQYGEGIYVGSAHSNWDSSLGSTQPYGQNGGTGPDRSDSILIQGNRISDTAAEGVDVKEGTTGGVIRGNTFRDAGTSGANSADSWVDIKGNGWLVADNTGSGTLRDAFQVHEVYDGWGRDNTFRGNSVQGGVPGYVVAVYPARRSVGNTVSCGETGAGQGTSNIPCSR